MAGTDSRFDANRFRSAIRFVMNMASTEDPDQDVHFHWKPEKTYVREDGGHNPFSWTATPVSTDAPTDLNVAVAISFAGQSAGGGRMAPAGTAVGEFDVSHGIVTVLDTEWATVLAHGGREPDQCIIDGDFYDIKFIAPPGALFEVTFYEIHIEAVDEH